ncbi:hypothetical protein [Allopontixanthobacter confluentis]|uniref:hypothetical protein n=1 Tax=Allopontixanthobacter confluentis TaxID=1849021 RepID=UPI001369A011|nr:hypothetical protein [Allopontixanthobacter confluentis]
MKVGQIKLWDRAEPIKFSLLWAISIFVLFEAFLLFGGKWVLVEQYESQGDNAYSPRDPQLWGLIDTVPATRSWRNLDCVYWTGRSKQWVEYDGEYEESSVPLECPFITDAR